MKWLLAFAALLVCGMPAIPASQAAPREIASPVAVTIIENTRQGQRCKCWGRVLDIRSIEASATAPASYEFTVRMHDGSLHTSPANALGSWKVGDRIIVMAQ
jgi:hypothetical protein